MLREGDFIIDTFGTFISRYVQENNITINELARKTKISHSTLDRWIAGDYKKSPNLDALNRLAVFTGSDLCDLVQFFYPQKPRSIDPSITRLAQQIAELPAEAQELMDTLILGLAVKNSGSNT